MDMVQQQSPETQHQLNQRGTDPPESVFIQVPADLLLVRSSQ